MIETGLKDKVVVTGGSAGIGRATALRFAAEGCRVAPTAAVAATLVDGAVLSVDGGLVVGT